MVEIQNCKQITKKSTTSPIGLFWTTKKKKKERESLTNPLEINNKKEKKGNV